MSDTDLGAPMDIRPPLALESRRRPPVPRVRPDQPSKLPDFSAFASEEAPKPPAKPDFSSFASEEPPKAENQFLSGLVGSTIGTNPKLAGDAAEGFGVLLDNEGLQSFGQNLATDSEKRITPAKVPSIRNIRTDSVGNFLSDVGDFAAYQTGNAIGSSVPSLVAGLGVGAVTANPVIGVIVGAAAPSYVQNFGDMWSTVRDDRDIQKAVAEGKLTKKGVAGTAAFAAIPMAALDATGIEAILSRTVFSEAKRDLTKRIVHGIVTGALSEGATEGLQQVVQEWAGAWLGNKTSMADKVMNVLDNAIAGMLGGGAMGGGAGVIPEQGRGEQARNRPGQRGVPGGAAPADTLYPGPQPSEAAPPPATPAPQPTPNLPGPASPTAVTAPDFSAMASEEPTAETRSSAEQVSPAFDVEQAVAAYSDAIARKGIKGKDARDLTEAFRKIAEERASAGPAADAAPQTIDGEVIPPDRSGGDMAVGSIRRGRDEQYGVDVEMQKTAGGYTLRTSDDNEKPIEIGSGIGGVYRGKQILNLDGEFVDARDITQASTGRARPENTPFKGTREQMKAAVNLAAEIEFAKQTGDAKAAKQLEQELFDLVNGTARSAIAPGGRSALEAPSPAEPAGKAATPPSRLPAQGTRPALPDFSTSATAPGSRQAPLAIAKPDDITTAAAAAAQDYSAAQGEANNRQLGHVKWNGLDGSVEVAAGGVRKGLNPKTGKDWSTTHTVPYGYWKGTMGADGMHVDAYFGPEMDAGHPVYVIKELDPKTGAFRQNKTFPGFPSEQAARDAYLGTSSKSEKMIGGITAMPIDEFKAWVKSDAAAKPVVADQKPADLSGENPMPKPAAALPTAPVERYKAISAEADRRWPPRIEQSGKGKNAQTNRYVSHEHIAFTNGAQGHAWNLAMPIHVTRDQVDAAYKEGLAFGGQTEPPPKSTKPLASAPSGPRVLVNKVGRDGKTDAERGGPLPKQAAQSAEPRSPKAATAKPLDESTVYEPAAKPGEGVTEGSLPGDVVDLNITPSDFAEITDEWAALFEAPKGKRANLDKVADARGLLPMDEAAQRVAQWKKHVADQGEKHRGENFQRTILSLFDYTGEWSKPYEEAGYNVIRFDIQNGQDVMDFSVEYFTENWDFGDVYGILAACPCTDFASSGARHFAAKDADGRTEASKELVFQTMRTIEYFRPKFWALENPLGRIERLTGLPPSRLSFNPSNFGAPYTKKTMLWGNFNADLPVAPVEPTEGSKMHRMFGGKSLKTKNARSETPEGFAYAFFMANNFIDADPVERTVADFPEASGAIKAAFKAGLSEDRIRALMYDTYENGDAEAARSVLARAVARRADQKPAKPPAEAWKPIGKNAAGRALFEDDNGVRSYVEKGIRVTEPVAIVPTREGVRAATPEHKGEWLTTDEAGQQKAATDAAEAEGRKGAERGTNQPAEAPQWWNDLTETGRAPLIAKASSTLSPKTTWANLSSENKRKIEAAYEAQQKAERDAPTWAQILAALPKGADGRPAVDMAFAMMSEITGERQPAFKSLSPEQKTELLDRAEAASAAKPTVSEEPPARTAEYGADNKLVSRERAEDLRMRLRAKLRNQINAGIDPEILAIGAELAAFHIEAGARRFADFAQAIAKDLGVGLADIRPYLRSWYNGARDMMEDAGFNIAGMDSPDQVREALKTLGFEDGRNAGAGSEPLGQGGERKAGTDLAEGPSERAGPDREVAPGPADDGRGPGEAGGTAGAGARPEQPVSRGGESVPEGGNDAAGRPRAGDAGVAPADTGVGGRPGDGKLRPAVRPNYFLADPDSLIGGGPKVRFARNKAALEAYRVVTEEGRDPTQAELDSMAAYIGWGSFGQELFQGTWERPRPKSGWETEDKWLREHLGRSEWESAQSSIINAHYTDPPTVEAMWGMVRQMGFDGGRILEPSMGIGNFFGLMPRDIMERSDLTGIELDELTGGMAKLLYPHANVQIMGYEKSRTPDNFYDVIIGNWPFAAEGPADRRYDALSPSLHDYFFVKAIDQVRPGGLVVGITSRFTMDKVGKSTRLYLAKKAELVAAYRLPTGAFEKYAGTAVVTDIIVLQKRQTEAASGVNDQWLEAVDVETPTGEVRINQYFRDHPENVLGTLGLTSHTTFGAAGLGVERLPDFLDTLTKLPERLPADTFKPVTRGNEPRFVSNNTKDRHGAITISDGSLYLVQGERLAVLEDVVRYKVKSQKETARREAQLTELVDLRRAYGRLIDAERDGDPATESHRNTLRLQYEAFRNAHGPIVDSTGLKIMRDVRDPFASAVEALETAGGKPARILSEPTTRGKRRLDQPSVREAFVVARNESVHVDIERVAELAGQTPEAAARELIDAKAVYRTPGGGYEVADVYLSGNVRRKLREAQDALSRGEDMQGSIDALKTVLPRDIPYFQIEAKLGATWIDNGRYREFLAHLLGVGEDQVGEGDVSLRFAAGSWRIHITNAHLANRPEARAQWGTDRLRFDRLFRSAMNNQVITIKYKDEKGNDVIDDEATAQANEKARQIRDEFSSWAWRDAERRVVLERAYNEVMNAIALPAFDGSFLDFSGMALRRGNDPFALRSHQINAIWRGIVNGRGLYAHEVGTGKTYTIGGIAVESRRYGVAKKPLILAHNANSQAVALGINEMYPGAQVLYVDNLSPATIETTLRRIANEDWDAVVMPHSIIDRLALKEETLNRLAAEQIAALEDEAMAAAEEDGAGLDLATMDDEKAMQKVRSPTAKQLVHQRNAVKAKIAEMAQRASREGAVAFEDLGVDMILVDEVHEFKKPPIATKMRLKGLNTQTSNRSVMLSFLTGYVKQMNGGKGAHLFTGTPITNTLTEIFNMMRFVMDDQMALDGVKDWDSWFNTFADSTNDVELTATGEYEPVTRLAAFVNTAELRRMAGQYMDIVFADDMPEFKPRQTASGKTMASPGLTEAERAELVDGRSENPVGRPYKKIVTDVGQLSPTQESILLELIAKARKFKAMGKKERREAMLSGSDIVPIRVETDAANGSLDPRLVNPAAPDDEGSKVNRAVRNILDIYRGSDTATQVVFMERGFSDVKVSRKKDPGDPERKIVTKTQGFNLARDLVDKLVEGGIPAKEIAIVDGGVSKAKREEIAQKMNRSEIRVVIGNSTTLGVGVNMQVELRAMHHLDAPWMPGILEQRNGRGWRQGNRWNTVLEVRYITERLDGRRWQVLAVKDRFIKAFLQADENTRIIEGDAVSDDESQDALGLAETLSEAAGDPRLLVVNKLKLDVERLEKRERLHSFGVADSRRKVRDLETRIADTEKRLPALDKDVAFWLAENQRPFAATINGATFDDRRDAQDAIDKAIRELVAGDKPQMLGTVRGFTLTADWSRLFMKEPEFLINAPASGTGYQVKGSVASIEATARGFQAQREKAEASIVDMEASIGRLKEAAAQPFQQQDQLDNKKRLLNEVSADIANNPVPPPPWLRHGTPIDSTVYVNGAQRVVAGHRWTDEDYVVVTEQGDVSYRDVRDEQGLPIYDPRPFEPPVRADAEADKGPPSGGPSRLGSVAEGTFPRLRPEIPPARRRRLEREATAIVQRVAGVDVPVRFEDSISALDTLEPWQLDELRAAARSRGYALEETALGYYVLAEPLIALAVNDPKVGASSLLSTAGHEAWHHVEFRLLTKAEHDVIAAEMDRIRAYAEGLRPVAGLPDYEVTAIAFQRYREMKEEGAASARLPAAVRRIFDKLAKVFRIVRNMLRRNGITRFEDIFEAARTGALAQRAQARQEGRSAVAQALGNTQERVAQTETPAFKRWFGESKVVDAEGKPLVVYHGTEGRDFETFFPASHFGTIEQANEILTGIRIGAPDAARGGNRRIYPVYLRITFPAVINDTGVQHTPRTLIDALRDIDLMDTESGNNIIDETTSDAEMLDAIISYLEDRGYDGLRYKNSAEGEGDSWVAFRPEQIKSATGNRGTFDPNNPSILGSTMEHGDASPFAPGGAEARKKAMLHGIEFAPLDRAMRLPFDIFGGRNAKGEWQPGLALSKKAARIITTARFKDESRFHWLNPILHRARAGLLDRYGLDEAYVARDRQRALDERGILADVPEIMQALSKAKVGSAEAQVLHAILTGEEAPTAAWQRISEPIRNAIDQMGAEAVELGLLSAESFERHRGAYLHRVYLKHENDQGSLARWVANAMSRRRKKIIGDQLKGRGLWQEASPDHLVGKGNPPPARGTRFEVFDRIDEGGDVTERRYVPDGEPAPDGFTSRGVWEVRGKRRGRIVLWRDYTKAERQRMGEITDARYTIAKTYMVMAHDLSVGRFYSDIAANADWSRGSEPMEAWKEASDYNRFWADQTIEWVRVPDTKIPKSNTFRYGKLAGRYVRAEIWRDINELEALNRQNLWQAVLTQWKLNKTARSPVVHMNNVVSNFVLMDMSGVTVLDLVAGIRSLAAGDAIYEEANHHGAFGVDMASQEIRRNVLQPILEEIERAGQGGQGGLEARFGLLGKLADGIWGTAKAIDRKMLDAYRIEDEVFRMALYAKRRGQGISAQEAADETRQQFIDYDIRAPWINFARRTVLPFLSYTYRAVPLVARTVLTRPWKIAKYAAVAYAVNALSYLMVPGDEDEERRSMQEEEQGKTWLGIPGTDLAVPRMIRMPFADSYGNPVFLDIRRWIPAGDVFDLNQGSAAIGIPAPLQFGGPLMMGAELMLNKQAFTGEPIVNELTDDAWDRASKLGDWAYKSWMPSAAWVPGSWYWTKIGNAMKGARDWQGKPYDTAEAMLSSVGIKVRPQDVQEGFRIWGIKFAQVERELKSQMGRLARDHARGLIGDAEYERARNKLIDKLQALGAKQRYTFTGE